MKALIDAVYINNSGGKILLDYLVTELNAASVDVFYLLDERITGSYPFLPAGKVLYLRAGLWQRYRFYRERGGHFESVLCFGNLPPPIRLKCPVYTYFHNVLYFRFYGEGAWLKRTKFTLKAIILKYLSNHSDEWWVQTEVVKQILCLHLQVSSSEIQVLPFFPPLSNTEQIMEREVGSFLYVSNANPHKNHWRLLEAFESVYTEFPYVRLYLTVGSDYPAVLHHIEELRRRGIPVINHGIISREALQKEYGRRACLVYPSLRECFGLGLIEAAEMGMPIVGADLEYTFAAVEPTIVFNPTKTESIALAMRQFLVEGGKPATLNIENEIGSLVKRLLV
jgi:glycosyltransferase involved in cell wall biosynthesis